MRPYTLRGLVGLLAVALGALGVVALLVPDIAAAFYGVETTTPSANVFVRAAGARDIAIAGMLIGLLARRIETATVGIAVLATTFVPIADSLIVLHASGVRPAVILHAGSILPMTILAIALIATRESS